MRKFANDGTRIHLKVFGSERGSVMERLTMTNDKGQGAFTFDLHVHCEPSEMRKIIKLADKLREYEDLEEQGLLIRLPCKVGDKVYVTERRVIKCKIKSIEFFECGISIKLMYAGENELLEHWKTSVTIDEFGEKVFLTEEEAEQALERRKNGKID